MTEPRKCRKLETKRLAGSPMNREPGTDCGWATEPPPHPDTTISKEDIRGLMKEKALFRTLHLGKGGCQRPTDPVFDVLPVASIQLPVRELRVLGVSI